MRDNTRKRCNYLDKRVKEKVTSLKVVADKTLAKANANARAATIAKNKAEAELNLTSASNEA
jgi:hypothetical protein